jgi:NTE family protein
MTLVDWSISHVRGKVRCLSGTLLIPVTSFLLLLAGCTATYPVNPPLAHVNPDVGYNITNVEVSADNHSQALVMLAFSGGGTRAAAFSYGVLKELSESYIGEDEQRRALTQEIDVISAVSGGSFTAAYYGLYGDRIFEDYEQVFLRRDVQGELTSQVLNPLNWSRLLSPYYTRADMATELYDDTIFNNATFSDLNQANGPFVIINATEMTLGTRFQFTQNYADIICTDLAPLPVARAVTASSAVPLLFSPLTITNRAGECGWQAPLWAEQALSSPDRTSRLYNLASSMMALNDREDHPYLHLFDGGLADNLGLRAMLDGVLRHDGIMEALDAMGMKDTRHVIVILVNAETALDVESSRRMQTPTFAASLGAATSVPLQRYSFETVALLKDRLAEWEQESHAAKCSSESDAARTKDRNSADNSECKGVDFHFVEVNFSEIEDPRERDYLKALPTSFVLTDEAVDRLIAAGGQVLRDNSEFKRLLTADR